MECNVQESVCYRALETLYREETLTCLCFPDRRSEEEKKAEETELFTKFYTDWKGGGSKDGTFKHIPRFYYRVSVHSHCLTLQITPDGDTGPGF